MSGHHGARRNNREVMIRFLRAIGILCFVALPYRAAAQNILPSSFAGWTASSPSTVVPSTGLDQLLGPTAAPLREYIVKSVEQRPYTHGTDTATITLYRLRDPSSAYGAYTLLAGRFALPGKSRLFWQRFAQPGAHCRRRNAA